jgi:hypothetical protein
MREYLLATLLLLPSLEAKAYDAGDVVFQTVNGAANQKPYYYGLKILNKQANFTFIWIKSVLGKSGNETLKAQHIKSHVLPTLSDLGSQGIVDSIYATQNPQDANPQDPKTYVKLQTSSSLEYDKHKDYYFSVVCTPEVPMEKTQCTIFNYPVNLVN